MDNNMNHNNQEDEASHRRDVTEPPSSSSLASARATARYSSSSTAATDNYNRQLDMENNNSVASPTTSAAECRLFINPYVFSDYAIGRYIDDTSQTRTLSSATSTAALGQDSWTMSVSPLGHSDLVRSASGVTASDYAGGRLDNCFSGSAGTVSGGAGDRQAWSQYPNGGKFKFLRAKFMRNRRNKLNRLSNKIAENTESSAYIKAENCFQDKHRMHPQAAAVAAASSMLLAPKVKPKVSKIAKGPARGIGGGGGGGGRGGGGRGGGGGGGDLNDPMMRRPRRKLSEKKQQKEQEMLAQLLSLEKYEEMWYL